MANAIAISQTPTTKTKILRYKPCNEGSFLEKATKFKFAAFKISSIPIKTKIVFFFNSKIANPVAKRNADTHMK